MKRKKCLYNIAIATSLIIIVAACNDGMVSKSTEINTIPSVSAEVSGKGGSMARFSVTTDALYVLTNNTLYAYDIKNQPVPVEHSKITLGEGMETVFVYDTLLFIGSQSGMQVYERKNGIDLEYVSSFWHATACDPVVFDGKHAYITLNSAHEICGRYINELHIVHMDDITNPVHIANYNMESPKGLGVDGDFLFVCDKNMLKVYDKTTPESLAFVQSKTIPDAYDVIPY
ncbi:MAG: hypothetical protein R6U95_02965, partial [Bacteroidales bacterium]